MDDKKLESQMKSSADGDVSAGETAVLSKDEQHLAKLGYKQGLSTRESRNMIDRGADLLTTYRQNSSATSGSSRAGPRRTSR